MELLRQVDVLVEGGKGKRIRGQAYIGSTEKTMGGKKDAWKSQDSQSNKKPNTTHEYLSVPFTGTSTLNNINSL